MQLELRAQSLNSDSLASSRRRALTILELCLSSGRGGLEHYAAGLVPALQNRGHRVLVVSKPHSEFERRTGQVPDMTLHPHRYLRWLGARKLARLASTADVIHIHRSADLALAVRAKVLAGNRPALVYTRHMLITRNRLNSLVHRYMFKHVDRLLTITEEISNQAHTCLPIDASRIQMLPLGVSSTAALRDCESLRGPGCDFVAGCFSRIEQAKGQHELIQAIARLREMGIAANCVIAGPIMDKRYAAQLRQQVKDLGLGNAVRFLGTLEDARPVMACCDVVVMPSTGEALGLVLIEAMMMKVPVIGSASGGVLEFITDGETGLTYPVGDVEALTQKLLGLVRDSDLAQRIAAQGYRAASERFDREQHLQRLERIFSSAVREEATELATA